MRDEAYRLLEESRTSERDDDLHLLGMRGWLRFSEDDLERGRADLEAAAASELRLGALQVGAVHLTVLARAQFAGGDWADAVVAAEQALALVSETEHPHAAFVWWSVILGARRARGLGDRGGLCRAGGGARRATPVDKRVAVGMALALLASARGDHAAVLAALEPVAELSPNPAVDEPGFWPWQDLYAEALVADGRADGGRSLPGCLTSGSPTSAAALDDRQARARARADRGGARARDAAAEAFARALEHIEPLEMPYERALIEFALGQFLRRNGRRRAAAEQLAARARDVHRARRAARARALRARARRLRAQAATGAAATQPPGSRPQEQAVARLVATGRSNREVAAELLVSVKTVEVHLTRIYAKLGVSSRAQLAALTTGTPYDTAAKE